jgi:peptidoglycan/xylan/chitin deacetylase (PgdA/CDA1 family)
MPASTVSRIALLCLALMSADALISRVTAADCADPATNLGVARTIEIDATDGPVFGHLTRQPYQKDFLRPKEVVLTFDDGPMPAVTRQILDTLDRFCTKATFFTVGQMAIAYPDMLREVLRRGHTVGTHTWSHPLSLLHLSPSRALDQIESGFAAATLAAGQPVAPFFRFPGLSDSNALVSHLRSRGIATFTVDVVSNDSYIRDPIRLIALTLSRLGKENGGIMLFHDIKAATARALPTILTELKARGFQVVRLVPKQAVQPDPRYVAALQDSSSFRKSPAGKKLLAITDTMPAPTPVPVQNQQPSTTLSTAATRPGAASAATPSAIEPTPLATAHSSAEPDKTAAVQPPDAGLSKKPLRRARALVPRSARRAVLRAAANTHHQNVSWISEYQSRAMSGGQ